MKFAEKNFLYLFIFGIMLVGCYKILDFKTNTEKRTARKTVEILANQVNPRAEGWVAISENALPNIPGRIYVLKTESCADIWHSCSITRLENREIMSAKASKLSETQKLDLLNTGMAPKGWEVVYVDEEGSPISSDE